MSQLLEESAGCILLVPLSLWGLITFSFHELSMTKKKRKNKRKKSKM